MVGTVHYMVGTVSVCYMVGTVSVRYMVCTVSALWSVQCLLYGRVQSVHSMVGSLSILWSVACPLYGRYNLPSAKTALLHRLLRFNGWHAGAVGMWGGRSPRITKCSARGCPLAQCGLPMINCYLLPEQRRAATTDLSSSEAATNKPHRCKTSA